MPENRSCKINTICEDVNYEMTPVLTRKPYPGPGKSRNKPMWALIIDPDTNIATHKVSNIAIADSIQTPIEDPLGNEVCQSVLTIDTDNTPQRCAHPLHFVGDITRKNNSNRQYLKTVLEDGLTCDPLIVSGLTISLISQTLWINSKGWWTQQNIG